jgi:N-acetylmuramoyl-L-alanine amidase
MVASTARLAGFSRWAAMSVLFVSSVALVPETSLGQSAMASLFSRPPAAAMQGAGKAPGRVTRTRFVIGLERPAEFQVFSLSSPNRVIVELPDVRMQLPATQNEGAGLVRSFRGGLTAPGKARVVIDVVAPVVVERAGIETAKDSKGHALVLDIVPVQAGAKPSALARKPPKAPPSALGAAGVQPPLPRRAVKPEERLAKSYKPVIVIDPGHGGHDTGASKNGIVEKNAVLAFSRALRDKLNARGQYNVLMTRDTDVFVPLDDRRAFAERNKAALFIAVHADYAGSHARGATIYSLREATASALRRSAKGEVSESVLAGRELAAVQKTDGDIGAVKGILADLAQREVDVTKERTNVIARSLVDYMSTSTSMRLNPDKEANFLVLKTAKVPAVLIELAYVSNAQDAQNLKSEKWRDKVSNSIATAVDNYFSNKIARLPM